MYSEYALPEFQSENFDKNGRITNELLIIFTEIK